MVTNTMKIHIISILAIAGSNSPTMSIWTTTVRKFRLNGSAGCITRYDIFHRLAILMTLMLISCSFQTDLIPTQDASRPQYKWMTDHSENLSGRPGMHTSTLYESRHIDVYYVLINKYLFINIYL